MGNIDELQVDQQQLVEAWQRTLPNTMNNEDRCEVFADEADAKALRITIHSAGRSMHSFDFKVSYVDSREVSVELIDVETDGVSVDERTEIMQNLIQEYRRHIHECAQALHELTHA